MPLEPSILPLVDLFQDDRHCGQVIGTPASNGGPRKGIDREGVIGIDHHALRIRPLIQPGWGRAGVAYGPYPRQNGLMFAVAMLNGHNTAQTGPLTDTFISRIKKWIRGSRIDPLEKRMLSFIRSQRIGRLSRELRGWAWVSQNPSAPAINENLAVGWFGTEVPVDPVSDGNAFIIHALGPQNGALWIRACGGTQPVIHGLQNLPIWFVVILREQGAAYYCASLPGAKGLPAYPALRPLGIDPFQAEPEVYAGVYQSVMGQIGFQVDTRVYGAQIEHLDKYAGWFGTAHAADHLTGYDLLDASGAEKGGRWQVIQGSFQRGAAGAFSAHGFAGDANLAILTPDAPSGLIHVILTGNAEAYAGGLVWRSQNAQNHWRVWVDGTGARLERVEGGIASQMALDANAHLTPFSPNSLQVIDDGQSFCLYLNGKQLFDAWFNDTYLSEACGAGFITPAGQKSLILRDFEAHPRTIPIPTQIQIPGPWQPEPAIPVEQDNFTNLASGDLHGCLSESGMRVWQRILGKGVFETTGDNCVRVRASAKNPNPGRTAYALDWDYPGSADLSVEVQPPGSSRGQNEKCRAGLIFWQDPKNYMIVNTWLDDYYPGASISSFFYLDGFEDIYDAVWTNIGNRINWGRSFRLRAAFDGLHYLVFVDDEPVLYRSLTDIYPTARRLDIHRVGMAANWEWGNDTGSILKHFEAKR